MQTSVLSEKVARGGFWLFAQRFLSRGLGFLRTIILARLLMPADFGLVGVALLAISTLDFLSQTGFHPALVQKKDCSRSHMDTAWTVMGIRGLVLFMILFLSAPMISRFFDMPALDLLIRVISISVVLMGFRNVGIVLFQKDLQFEKQFKYQISGTLVDIIVSIYLAFYLRNVWALVWGGLAGNITRFCMSYWLSGYRPRIAVDWSKLKDLFLFGKWVLGVGIIYSLLIQVDSFSIGKILGPAELGYYQMAFLFASLPSSEISYVVTQVTFPAYTAIQDDPKRLRAAYIDVLRLTSLVSIPLGALIFVVAPEFTALFLGKKWEPIVICMQILVFSGISTSISSTSMPVFSAKGKPKYETYLQACTLTILIILVFPLTKLYGIHGTSIALLAAHITLTSLTLYVVGKLIDCQHIILFKILMFPFGTAVFMGMVVFYLKHLTAGCAEAVQFAILVSAAILSYGTLVLAIDKIMGYGIIPLLKQKWAMIRKINLIKAA